MGHHKQISAWKVLRKNMHQESLARFGLASDLDEKTANETFVLRIYYVMPCQVTQRSQILNKHISAKFSKI